MTMQQTFSFLEEDDSNSSNSCLLLHDALYCEEKEQRYWGDEDEEGTAESVASVMPIMSVEHDLFWEDEELLDLFSKEQQQQQEMEKTDECSSLLTTTMKKKKVRSEAVKWMVKAISHHGFSPLTGVLSINYLDRFLSNFHVHTDKPWMIQLVAVSCLSLAAKVEEIHVPLLLDLQVGDAKYVFESKTIQRMEVVVLSTLQWKMHPVTPLSFLDHIVRRLGLKTELHLAFLSRCQPLIFSLVSDSTSVGCLPSVLAAATMMHVIDVVEPTNPLHYKIQLLHVLRLTKEKVDECYQLIERILLSRDSSSSNRKRNLDDCSLLQSEEEEEQEEEENSSSWSSSLKRSRLLMKKKTKWCGSSNFAPVNHAFAISSPR